MRPPICAICHERFLEGGQLLSFALTPEQELFNKRFEQPGFVGHPAGLEWFCAVHASIAQKYTHLTYSEAMKCIKQESEDKLNSKFTEEI